MALEMESSVGVLTQPLPVPSKWDIIPIHASDIASYKRCRRYWNWTSPARNNLRRRVDIGGIKIELWFGTGCHYALEMKYNPTLSRDPVEAFRTWYQLQWDGGLVEEDWLERTYDANPKQVDSTTWNIRGLREMLPFIEQIEEEIEFHRDLGIGMMEFYKGWSERNDDFITVAAESVFSIPLGFEARDIREDSPNYGKMLEVHVRGKRDAVIYYPEMDKFGINDHKTAAKIGEDYFAKLEKDEQCSTYLWATIMEAQMFDVPWADHMVDRVLYTALRKNYPQPPTITAKQGLPSLDRTNEGTTAELFQECIQSDPRYTEWFTKTQKAQDYYTYLLEMGDSLFVQRDLVTRNVHEISATGNHLKMVAQEMLNDPNIYPNPSSSWLCIHCAFRSPCIAADDGSDWIGMLNDGYETNRGR